MKNPIVLHECLQVELAKSLYEKRELKALVKYLTKMKESDIRTFQRTGSYLRDDEKDDDIIKKLYEIWCDIASNNRVIPNE